MLVVENLTKEFNGIRALNRVNCTIKKGQIHGLIGPNGSGKTTFFNVLTGLIPASKGKIYFESKEISDMRPYLIAKLGISRTFQRGFIAPSMTCIENVMAGAHGCTRTDIIGTFLRRPFIKSTQELKLKIRARELLHAVGLDGFEDRWAGDLVWIERQLLQIARALAANPKLLLLDEPTAGMGPGESQRVSQIIRQVLKMGVTIILVSHDMNLMAGLAEWITVLNSGEKICEGPPDVIKRDPKVLEAYLGSE
jgi:branched-chain amino acid transport system ATP-binding protein